MATEIIEPAAEIAVGTDEAFLELVCADDDWLRAEFEAIVEAGWPAVPPRESPPSWPERPGRRRTSRGSAATAQPPHRPDTGDDDRGRQRSPPRR
jgi:hypothetical protein